jgi:hypothetical protein
MGGSRILMYFFSFFGGILRWIYGSIWRNIAEQPKYTFSEYINGPKNSDDWHDNSHRMVNFFVGLFVFLFIVIKILN